MNDTVKLLRECNAGIKMGESALERVIPTTESEQLKDMLNACKDEHATLGDRTHSMLIRHGADTKEPHAIARMMSDAKICTRLAMCESDHSVASLMTDGCNMGVKSLSKYLNRYKGASPEAKDIARKLIESESTLSINMRPFL